jgi:poly-gamma-glutamate synthesis protein (capsule biosynthesis protein)
VIAERLAPVRRTADVVVASVHWGSNWGYRVPSQQRLLAHRLIDVAGVDLVHGHSSHHPRPIEVYRGRLVLYGCGDFITDYEGISGHEEFRDDLVLGYLPSLDASGGLVRLRIAPYQLRRFQLGRPSEADAAWMAATLDHHSRSFGTRVELATDGWLDVSPSQ